MKRLRYELRFLFVTIIVCSSLLYFCGFLTDIWGKGWYKKTVLARSNNGIAYNTTEMQSEIVVTDHMMKTRLNGTTRPARKPHLPDVGPTSNRRNDVGLTSVQRRNDSNVNNKGNNDSVSLKPLPIRDVSFYRINTTMSDRIGPNRTIPDARPEKCKHIKYPDGLPKISVVVIFREEWPSVLLRTVYSILDNSPPYLLQEIVLVDDGSIDTEPKQQIKRHFADVKSIKLLVNPKPLGLMMARQRGIESTTTNYFVVMDSHIEVTKGWLTPIVARLVEEPANLISSHVGSTSPDTFKVKIAQDPNKSFVIYDPLTMSELWATYNETYTRRTAGSVDPIPIASVQGMIIAMKKDFFMRLGGFDPGMKQWGSEQFELSIKVWLCGGRVEKIPCSKVSHVFRPTPWGHGNKADDYLVANSLRTSEVWMNDPYKSIIREVIGQHSTYDIGDLSDRRRIRKENHCKPFQHFVDMVKTFSDVYLPGKIKAKGPIRNKKLNKCLSTKKQKDKSYKIGLETCKSDGKFYYLLTEHNQIRSTHGTIVRTKTSKKQDNNTTIVEVVKSPSYSFQKNAVWIFRRDGRLFNMASNSCLTVGAKNTLVSEKCTDDHKQQWEWERVGTFVGGMPFEPA